MDAAWRDTLVHAAVGDAFRRVARTYEFVYQFGIAEGSWRRALLELAYGRRGTKKTTFDVIRHAFRQYDILVEVEVDPSTPTTLTFVSSPGLTAFGKDHVGRYISTPYGVLWSMGPVLCSGGPPTSATITVSPHAAADWAAPAWPFTVTTRFTVRILPFILYETQQQPIDRSVDDGRYYDGEQCRVDVYFLGDILPLVPTTYLQENDSALTAAGVPFGGQLLDDAFTPGDPLGDGPHPLYLVDDSAFEDVRVQVQSTLAAGVELRFIRSYTYPC
jgi:hypothetical protein